MNVKKIRTWCIQSDFHILVVSLLSYTEYTIDILCSLHHVLASDNWDLYCFAVEDLNLHAVESLRGLPYLAIGKHLCGSATGEHCCP